jgi:hypothetical protein
MQKIISLFKRDYKGTRQVYDEIVPGAEWVVAGEGMPTVKIDGTSCLVQNGMLYKRYDAKKGRMPPFNFIPAQDPDPVTRHWPGWVPCNEADRGDRWHFEAFHAAAPVLFDGTYELIGPKVQGNPYGLSVHRLVMHGSWRFDCDVPRDFGGLKAFLESHPVEGIVWHHPDGRMVKIKARDLGLPWPVSDALCPSKEKR